MKKIFTLLVAASIGTMAFGQVVFQSDLSSWAAGTPTDWFGSKTNLVMSGISQITGSANYGTDEAALINIGSGHKRFTTISTPVVGGTTYNIEMWVSGVGELRTGFYDETNLAYLNPYNGYNNITAGPQTVISQSVTMPATCTDAQFILSLRNTDSTGILLDSVYVGVGGTPPPPPAGFTSIYDIQFTTNPNGNSPEENNIVTTRGVVTAYVNNTANFGAGSFFIQDGDGAWNGLYIYNQDTLLTPSVGDSIEVTGSISEFNLGSATQAVTELSFISNLTVLNSGNTLPNTTTISTSAANSEDYEGVLIKVTNAEATAVGSTLGFGLWEMNDGSGALKGDDDMFAYHLQANQGAYYDVTGIGHYSFDDYKILPRKPTDVSLFTGVDELSGVTVTVYPNPVRNAINFKLGVAGYNVNIVDVTGKIVKAATSLNNKLSVEVSNLNNGIYFYSIAGFDGNLISTNKFIVAK